MAKTQGRGEGTCDEIKDGGLRFGSKATLVCGLTLILNLSCQVEPSRKDLEVVYQVDESATNPLDTLSAESEQIVVYGDVGFRFLDPREDQTVSSGAVRVSIEIADSQPTNTWSLYYAPARPDDLDNLSGATPIFQGQSVQNTLGSWDITFVQPGTYSLFATVRSGDRSFVYRAPSTVVIDNGLEERPDRPRIVIVAPQGDQAYPSGESIAVQFQTLDQDAEDYVYQVEYSLDGGGSWTQVAGELPAGTTSVDWTPPEASAAARSSLRLTVNSASKGSAVAESEVFGIASDPDMRSDGRVKDLVDRFCVQCHGPSERLGDLRLDGANRIRQAAARVWASTRVGGTNPMPPASEAITDAERQELADVMQFWQWNEYR